MPTTLDRKLKTLPRARRRAVEKRAAELIDEEVSLRTLRQARRRTQAEVAGALGVGQERVSRLERHEDLLVSTLRDYVEALGGKLRLVADLPGLPAITLSGSSSGRRPASAKRGEKATGHRHRCETATRPAKRATPR